VALADGDSAGDVDTAEGETKDTADAEAEDAWAGVAVAEGEDAEAGDRAGRDGPDDVGGIGGLDGLGLLEGAEGLDGWDGWVECPGAGRRPVSGGGCDVASDAVGALPCAVAVAEADDGAGTGVGVVAAVDGLNARPHAEAWPSGRAITPRPMSSPVARSVAPRSHGVTSESPHDARLVEERGFTAAEMRCNNTHIAQ
jgi:hypothetical protein